MTLNDKNMSKYARNAYEVGEGKRLYINNLVTELQTEQMESYWGHEDCYEIRAVVYEHRQPHAVKIIMSDNDEMMNCKCDCNGGEMTWQLCRHGCAAIFRFDYLRRNGEIKRKTSRAAMRLVETMSDADVQEALPETDRGVVRIVPRIHINEQGLQVSFKIGIRRMYLIKDLVEFASACYHKKTIAYGKDFETLHDESVFTPESVGVYHFILDHVAQQVALLEDENYYGPDQVQKIPLGEENIDEIFRLMEDREVELHTSYQKGTLFRVVEKDFKLQFHFHKTMDGVEVYRNKLEYFTGAEHMYKIDITGFKIYRSSKAMYEACEPLLVCIPVNAEKPMFLRTEDLRAFCGVVVPIMKQYGVVKENDVDLEQYEPEECKIRFYLDAPSKDRITCRPVAVYGEEEYDILEKFETLSHYKNIKKETQALRNMQRFMGNHVDEETHCGYFEKDDASLYRLVANGITEFHKYGEVYVSDALKKVRIRPAQRVSVGVSLKSDLLQLKLNMEDFPLEELQELLSAYRTRKNYYRLKSGEFIQLDKDCYATLDDLVTGLDLTAKDLKEKTISVEKYHAFFLDKMSQENEEGISFSRDQYFDKLMEKLNAMEKSTFEVPDTLHAQLREYQIAGYRWLRSLEELGFGGILADDMGLGKTIQVITYLLSMKGKGGPSLIVCPASLVYNWESELYRFAPDLKVSVLAGGVKERREAFAHMEEQDVVVTSYDLLKRDIEKYQEFTFHTQVIDEAQYIKNHNTQMAKAVKSIHAKTRFALTGTPVENRLSELWSIFDYLMPGLLYHYSKFKEELEAPIVNEQDDRKIKKLQHMVHPFILRRLKTQVLKDLPEKIEEVLYAKAEGEQWKLYQAYTASLVDSIEAKSVDQVKTEKLQILAGLTRLRQLCCDPGLVYENYTQTAAKLEMCMELVDNAVGSGHKILIFSQFTTMLDRIALALKKKNISYYMLTGTTKKADRAAMVEQFQNDDTNVFLISLKAGGTGLNLTAADIVIHFDPWWNVASQNQATDRAHRIGQKNIVTVYKLIMKNSIEEKILKLQENKMHLADQIISGEGVSISEITKEDLLELLS